MKLDDQCSKKASSGNAWNIRGLLMSYYGFERSCIFYALQSPWREIMSIWKLFVSRMNTDMVFLRKLCIWGVYSPKCQVSTNYVISLRNWATVLTILGAYLQTKNNKTFVQKPKDGSCEFCMIKKVISSKMRHNWSILCVRWMHSQNLVVPTVFLYSSLEKIY